MGTVSTLNASTLSSQNGIAVYATSIPPMRAGWQSGLRPAKMPHDSESDRQISMIVQTLSKGREALGLLVGSRNARRYFSRDAETIEIQLDHLTICCEPGPQFWDGDAEIRDPRLSAWLELKNFHGLAGQPPVRLAMTPTGANSFRLQTVKLRAHTRSGKRAVEHDHRHTPVNAA